MNSKIRNPNGFIKAQKICVDNSHSHIPIILRVNPLNVQPTANKPGVRTFPFVCAYKIDSISLFELVNEREKRTKLHVGSGKISVELSFLY